MTQEQKIVSDILTQIHANQARLLLVSDKIYSLIDNELSDNWGYYLNFPNSWLINQTVLNCRILSTNIPDNTIEIITKSEQWIIEN